MRKDMFSPYNSRLTLALQLGKAMMETTENKRFGDASALLAALEWQVEMGADESIADQPVDRFAAKPESKPEKPALPATTQARPKPAADAPLGAADAVADGRKMAASCDSLASLRDALEAFDGCALKQTATNLVFGDGAEDADIMFVGEAPGRDEDIEGRPFVGVSGQMLDLMLSFIDLDRTRFHITNTLYWRPPGNRTPTDAEIAICRPFLEKHIALINPKVIVFVGGASAKAMLNTTQGITKIRGKWHDYSQDGLDKPIPALPTFHPAYLLRNSAQKKYAWRDAVQLKRKLDELGIG